jgi:uncharacterized membrane protein YdbT with pleckstrin-like domain
MSIDTDGNEAFFQRSKPIHGSLTLLIVKLIFLVFLFDVIYAISYFLLSYYLTSPLSFIDHVRFWLLIALVLKNIMMVSMVTYVVLKWATTLYYIEGDHLVTRRGILSVDENIYEFKTIRSLEVEQSLLGRLFHYGNIILKTSASGGYLVVVTLLNLANPQQQEKTLSKYF